MRFPLKSHKKVWCEYRIIEVKLKNVLVKMTFLSEGNVLFSEQVEIPRIGNGTIYEDLYYIANDVYSKRKDATSSP